VTHMTNRVKNLCPGDFYKIWVDLACVFYNRIYRVGKMSIIAFDAEGKTVKQHVDKMILYLMGASGNRTYGSNQKILPDGRNVCGIHEMSLAKKLAMKKHFKNGTHISFPVTEMYSASKLEIGYSEKILVQLDGEGCLLDVNDFPLVMELSKPFISVIKPN